MSDPNRPHDPGQQNNPSVPSAGSPYGGPGGSGAPGQPGYAATAPGPYGAGQPGFGQQPPGSQPGFGQHPPYGQPQGGFAGPGMGAQASAQFGGGGVQQPPPGWGAAPVPPPGQPGRSGSKLPLIIGGAAVLIIALIFGMTQFFNRSSQGTAGTPTTTSPSASTGSGTGAGSASEVVQRYFDALAASDPDAIFGLMRSDLPDRTFLTKEVLAAATAAAPISDLELTELEASKYTAQIQATYTINGRPKTQKFYVASRDNVWTMTTVTARLYVKGLSPADTGLTVNGVAVPDVDSIEVFPGGYTLGTTSDTFGLSQQKVVVESLGSSSDVYDIKVVLSSGALKDFKSATTKLVNSCKKPGGLKNADCAINFRAPSGVKIKASSVACTPSGTGSIDRMKPTLDTSDMSVRASLNVKFSCSLTSTSGRRFTGTDYLFSVYGKKTDAGWTSSAQRP